MMRKRTKISKAKKQTYAIIVDGKTEVWYFQMLKRNEPGIQVNIEPKIPQKKKLSEQYKKVCELAEYYTKVFWIIDLDKIIQDNKLNDLIKLLRQLNVYGNVVSIINNPCLELWFLLHYKPTSKYFPKCDEVEKELKKHLKDYKKTQKYFTKQNNDIYLRLKPNLKFAINNAKQINNKEFNEMKRSICEMNLFFDNEKIQL